MQILNKFAKRSAKNEIIYRNVLGAFGVKGVALVISLYTMPAYMKYFDNQQILGVWFTIVSIMSWILNFDLGIGNGLRNHLTAVLVREDYSAAKEYISSSYWLIGIIVAVFTLMGYTLMPIVAWNDIFNVETSIVSKDTMLVVVRIVFVGMMLQFFLRLITSILYALQKAAINNLIALTTSILQLLFALVAPQMETEKSLVLFAVAYVFCANIPLIIATIIVFAKVMRNCIPVISAFKIEKAKSVLSLGGVFFACQVLYMLIANTNEFFITQYTNPSYVVEYQVYNRLFTLGSTLFLLALTPVWSAVSRAVAERDFYWLKKINKIMMIFSGIAIVAEFLMLPLLQLILDIWLGEESIEVNYLYGICFAIFGSVMIFQCAVSTMANGIGKIKTQVICYAMGMFVKLLIVHIGIKLTGEWIIVVLANAIILLPYCIIQQVKLNKYFNAQIERK
ncbi:MAG: hypothetical protein IJ420_11000 [Lachnospiraceae bacterium]|nr:hypothetical protein [Lachnospiraceae bacterium]